MESSFDRERLSKWLEDVASTEDEEIDCDTLAEMMESIVAISASSEDVRNVLPDIALHLRHCAGCSEWYETLVELAKHQE
jgi:hypothetical protein